MKSTRRDRAGASGYQAGWHDDPKFTAKPKPKQQPARLRHQRSQADEAESLIDHGDIIPPEILALSRVRP